MRNVQITDINITYAIHYHSAWLLNGLHCGSPRPSDIEKIQHRKLLEFIEKLHLVPIISIRNKTWIITKNLSVEKGMEHSARQNSVNKENDTIAIS